jgi:hypothetical protein
MRKAAGDWESRELYEYGMDLYGERVRRAEEERIVIKPQDQPVGQARQGYIRYYLHEAFEDCATSEWKVFAHQLTTKSGKHTHQGGLALYVRKGEGYTVVNGVKYPWKAGDLILLPIMPGGCEHQHFNTHGEDASEWVAFIHLPWFAMTGSEFRQREDSPDWKEQA